MVHLLLSITLIIIQSAPVWSASLFNGSQALVFPANTSAACLAAFDTPLSCDPKLVQFLPRMDQYAQWTTNTKTTLCSTACGTSLQALQSTVNNACGAQSFAWTSTYMLFTDVVEMYYYKFQLICLKDTITGAFCSDVESTWNITQLNNTGAATWPNNTRKLYPDPDNNWFLSENDEESTLGFTVRTATDPSTIDGLLEPAIEDYYYNRSGPADWVDTNYGWQYPLEYDEYPLEIQCHNCFINRFILGIESKFGLMYHEITVQYWNNWKLNCGLTTMITPAMNVTNAVRESDQAMPVVVPSCPRNISLASATQTTCNSVSLLYSIPLRGFVSLNYYPGGPSIDCNSLRNGTFCAPISCPLAVVGEATDAANYVRGFSNFTLPSFLSWNPSLSSGMLLINETVCVGPPGPAYIPSIISAIPNPTAFTQTAQPAAPTASGTFRACGEYHVFNSGELCVQIVLNYSITYTQFLGMNPSVNAQCNNLLVGNDYCVFPVNGSAIPTPTLVLPPAPPTSTSSTSTSTGNGISTPTPTQPGMTTSCSNFYLVKSGDQCGNIATYAGISLAQFYAWSPSVGTTCASLFANAYVCIGVIGCTAISPQPSANYCGRVGIAISASGSGTLVSYNSGSPYVNSVPACAAQCLATPACQSFFFTAGSSCSLQYGPVSFQPNGIAGSAPYYQESCFQCPSTVSIGNVCAFISPLPSNLYCGRVGLPGTATGSGTLVTYSTNSPYVSSVGVCAAQCSRTTACTSIFFTAGSSCILKYGPISFSPNGNPGSAPFYDASCFSCPSSTCAVISPAPANIYCGRVGLLVAAAGSGVLTTYSTNSPYVDSVGVCAEKCLQTPACANFFFTQGSGCVLQYGPVSFSPNGNPGSAPFYDASCFACPATNTCPIASPAPSNLYCGRVGLPAGAAGSGKLQTYSSTSPYVFTLGVCAAQCAATSTCTSFYFTQGSSCILYYGPISFSPNGNVGAAPFYDIGCFPSCH